MRCANARVATICLDTGVDVRLGHRILVLDYDVRVDIVLFWFRWCKGAWFYTSGVAVALVLQALSLH